MVERGDESKAEKLQSEYNKLEEKQDKWGVIENLNKLYRVDRILLKYAYKKYPQKKALEESREYKSIEKFYRYILDNIFAIEKNYLMDELVLPEGEVQNNYQINRSNTSKYIRDEHEYYNHIFAKYSAKSKEEELGLNGQVIYQFVQQCFTSPYTQVLLDGHNYFQDQATRKAQFQDIIKSYYHQVKEIGENDFAIGDVWLEENEILDFLTYWLKHNQDQELYILYCRTEEKLKRDASYLRNQAKKSKKNGSEAKKAVHPTKFEMEEIQQQIQIDKKTLGIDFHQQVTDAKKSDHKIDNILQKFRKNHAAEQNSGVQQIKQELQQLNRKQQLEVRLPEFFSFGCKRRYTLSKSTTFEQISAEAKTMNLQKFINFCNYFGLNKFLSRELLTEIFKLNALNRLTIDEKRFTTIMKTLIQTSKDIIELLLNKKPINIKLRSQAKLSNYKFSLRPLNGKLIQNLQYELQSKKSAKSKDKEEKLNLYLARKLNVKEKGQLRKQKVVMSSRVLPQSTNILELENMRDDSFDPAKFFGNDHDEMLSMYESKFEQKKLHPSALESALSKRLQKGAKIIDKINNKSLKHFD